MSPFVKALRAPFLAGSIIPVIIGACLSFSEREFSFPKALITIFGIGSLHLAANLLNDYYDARGSDPINLRVTPFSGGSRVIQNGEIGAGTILAMSIFFLSLALLSAIWLVQAGRPLVLPLGLLGLFAGWSYSATPLQFMSRGWGETLIFFAFGPLVTLGAYYVNSASLSFEAFAIGFPQGFLITGVIWINQFPDYKADKEAGKKNLVVRLGPGISRYLYCLIIIMSFISITLLVGIMGISYLIMVSFVSFPFALRAMSIAWREYLSHKALIPAQALTIQTILVQGLALSLGLLLSRYFNV